MIVYTNAALLGTDSGVPFENARILYEHLARFLSPASIFVSSEDPSGPRDAVVRPDSGEYWMPTSLPATIRLDLGALKSFNSVGVVGTLGQAQVACKVETSPDNVTYSALATEVLPADNTPLLYIDTLRSHRHVRVTLSAGDAAPLVMPKLSVVQPGKALAMMKQVSAPWVPISMARKTEMQGTRSRGGQLLGQSFRRNGIRASATFKNLLDSWVRANFDAFSLSARSFPFFMAWNPSLFPLEVGYCWATDDIVPTYNGNNVNMDVSWEMEGVGSP